MQTFGDLVNFNPHLHILAADGVFTPSGCFVALPSPGEAPASELAARAKAAWARLIRKV